jgi:hypothetical protein
MGSLRALSPRFIAVVAVAVGLSLACGVAPLQFDGAYLSYRAAANLASGRDPAPGGAPAGGGRLGSPAWILALAAVATRFGEPSIRWGAIGLGIAGYLLTLAALGRDLFGAGSGPAGGPPWGALVSLSLFAASPPAVLAAATGFPVLIFSAIAASLALAVSGGLPLFPGVVASLLAIWIHPEGAWLPLAMLAQCAGARSLVPLQEGRGRRLVLALLAGAAALAVWRWSIFGRVVPESIAAWRPMPFTDWIHAVSFFVEPPGVALLACAILGAIAGGRVHSGYLAAGLSWIIAPLIAGGGGPESVLPSEVSAIALLALAAGGLAMAAPTTSREGRAIALIVASAFALGAGRSATLASAAVPELRASEREMNSLAEWLARRGARSVALVETGRVGYRTGAAIVDLGEETIQGAEESAVPILFGALPPEYLILRLSWAPGAVDSSRESLASIPPEFAISPAEREVMADPRFKTRFRPLFLIVYPRDGMERGPRSRLIAARDDLPLGEGAETAPAVLVDR